ncbi:TonB-dependent receptor [Marivirga atlantica]|uniref:TonB-dependent receptor n=1 Tax=Marivirga atlantica TaxID=1548457 RepID=A0A937DKF4_9BACT|nr:TonB-dependent receptor [Marivirga atlantica]MBL0766880.1 TonB-dependent receptor [Marivirga atlantica]
MKRISSYILSFSLIFAVATSIAVAQNENVVTGQVVDGDTNEPLPGANVVIQGTSIGTTTDIEGNFSLPVPTKSITLEIRFIGFKPYSISLNSDDSKKLGKINLESGIEELSTIEVVASRITRDQPFTYTEVAKKKIQEDLGSRDLPMVLNTAPSVYSTNQGGGSGDARLTVRGFNNQNVGVMINGVPVNDMENGLVYWSNWDGLGDAASSIQVQKGISPVNLAVPSVGGTVNIITDPATRSEGTMIKQEVGSWNFSKTTISHNTGLINDKFAASATVVKKTGDGFAQGLYTDSWAYYMGLSYQINDKNKIEGYVVGAPQTHGQNLYAQNIARYSHDFARSLDSYDPAAFNQYREAGRDFNQNYGGVNPTYSGSQYYEMYKERTTERQSPYYIMERENFYHKPQVNLNYFMNISEKLQWNTVLYWSGGKGGGSGTFGSVATDYSFNGMGVRQWDDEIAQNTGNIDSTYSTSEYASTGIMRNSVNQQDTYGAITKLFYDVNESLSVQIGLDARTASIYHWREVRDLLGGDYYTFTGNDFDTSPNQYMKRLGDKIDYHNVNTVNWLGAYAQGQYQTERVNIFLMGGYTGVKYDYTDFFTQDDNGNELNIVTDNLPGYQVKAGFTYNFSRYFNAYVNGGYISRNPIFDYAIDDGDGVAYDSPENEKITTFEFGAQYAFTNTFVINAAFYNTSWADRTITRNVRQQNGDEDFLFIGGLEQIHTGLELEASFKPIKQLRFDAGASFANWYYANDVSATYTTYEDGSPVEEDFNLYIKDLKVGDAPQSQFFITTEINPISNLSFKIDYRYYDRFYSNFDPLTRTDETDRTQSWQVPSYSVVDFRTFFTIPMKTSDYSIQLFASVFNLFDEVYIQDATDNSRFNAFDGDHDADDAEVFLGLPRNFNAGVTIRF